MNSLVNPMHLATNSRWLTPYVWIDKARACMGSIDLDPASSAQANFRVQAGAYMDPELDGLSCTWTGNVFLNPPGSKTIPWRPWLYKLHDELNEGRVDQAFYVGYNLEQLRYVAAHEWNFTGRDVLLCVPHKRIRFLNPDTGKAGVSPTHGNFMLLVLHSARVPHATLIMKELCHVWGACPY